MIHAQATCLDSKTYCQKKSTSRNEYQQHLAVTPLKGHHLSSLSCSFSAFTLVSHVPVLGCSLNSIHTLVYLKTLCPNDFMGLKCYNTKSKIPGQYLFHILLKHAILNQIYTLKDFDK